MLIQTLLPVLAAAFFSGVAALVYEVSWARMLVVPLGNSAYALSLVLAAFMVGMASGARLLGGAADRVKRPLLLFAGLETAICLYALAMPSLVTFSGSFPLFVGSFQEAPATATLRFAAAFMIVAAPSALMGATVPVLIRAVSTHPGESSKRIGPLYGLNTLGGAAGAALAGFVGAPLLGLRLTTALASILNVTAAALALFASRSWNPPEGLPRPEGREGFSRDKPSRRVFQAAIVAAGAIGFVVLALETLWARVLTFAFGFDTYAFAVLLMVVLLGLGAGGAMHRLFCRRDPAAVMIVLLCLFALAVPASFWAAAELFPLLRNDAFGLAQLRNAALKLRLTFLLELLYTPVLVFFPSLLAGAAFPAACTLIAGPAEESGRRVGTIYLVNGLGSTAGALAAPFLITPWLGIDRSFQLYSLAVTAAAVAVFLFTARQRRSGLLLVMTGAGAAALLAALLIPRNLAQGMLMIQVGPKHQKLLHYDEGPTSTVSVIQDEINGEKQLLINAVVEVSTRLVHDQSFKLLGHLGFLLHPDPRQALAICLGGGLSAGAAIQHDIERLDMVEIDAAVQNATRLFSNENNGVLDHPRFHLHINDGRQFLYGTSKRYDVIFIDSTHPKAVDSWILYTREFYQLVRERLDAEGIVVQWVPVHGLSEREFKIIVRTFHEVFPESTLWANVGVGIQGNSGYVKMVGGTRPLSIDYRELSRRLDLPRIRDDLEPFGMADPEEILDSFLAGPGEIAAWTEKMPVQTDDRPLIPYITGYTSGRPMTESLLLGVRSPVLPYLHNLGPEEARIVEDLNRAYEAQGWLMAGRLDRAAAARPEGRKIKLYQEKPPQSRRYLISLSARYKEEEDADALAKIGGRLEKLGFYPEAKDILEGALSLAPESDRIRNRLGIVLLRLNDVTEAARLFSQSLENNPRDLSASVNLGLADMGAGKNDEAIEGFRRALSFDSDSGGEISLFLGKAYLQKGEADAAEKVLLESAASYPWKSEVWYLLSKISLERRDFQEARTLLSRTIDLDPLNTDAYYSRGNIHLGEGSYDLAIADFDSSLAIEGGFVKALNNRGAAYARKGDIERALRDFTGALEIDPAYAGAYANRARAYHEIGEFDRAWADVEMARRRGYTFSSAFLERLGESTAGGFEEER